MKRLILLVIVFAVSIVRADKPFDPGSGRDPRNFPPDAQVNFQHIAMDIKMPDPASRSFTCDETITFAPPRRSIDRLDLNAVDLQISAVTDLENKPLNYRYDDKVLTVKFMPALAAETQSGIKIRYTCSKPKEGMIFAVPDEQYRDRPLQIHTQGEPQTNRFWFVSHDYPNAKQTTEIAVTIPAKYKALSNGALVSRDDVGDGLVRYHYKLGHPHVSYLVSLVIGEFAVVTEEWRGKPVEYWVAPANESHARRTFGKTPEMIELFSKLTRFDYPWEKYAQAVVVNFDAGGMENTSCTTLVETTNLDERAAIDSDAEGLISHELAHQWFGDVITCKSWPHTWLNEGFATFMDAVWHEHAHGVESYEHQIWQTMQGVAESDDPAARGGIVWHYYDDPWEIFGRRVSNPYGKGSCVIHTLRRSLGDELFWDCIGTFLKRHAFQTVETDDLRKVCDELSGRSYERFFQQWLYRAGTPKIKVKFEWDDRANEAKLTFEQTQTISDVAPAFEIEIPVWLFIDNGSDGDVVKQLVKMDSRRATMTAHLQSEPTQVLIDPQASVLAKWELDVPVSALIAQAKSGPTSFARYGAIAALGGQDRDDARQALKSILLDEKQHETIRSEAAMALGKMQQNPARDILVDALAEGRAIRDARVRRSAVEALGGYHGATVTSTLLRFAKSDQTYSVEATATEMLGRQDGSDAIVDQLIANAGKPSYRDQIRSNSLRALGELAAERGLKPAMKLAEYGQPYRLRPAAIEAIAKIGRDMKDHSEVRKFLVNLLDDPQHRSAEAAIAGLGTLGDEKAIPALQKIADSSAPRNRRDAARSAIDTINKHETGDTLASLRHRIEVLEKATESKPAPATQPAATTQP